MVTSETNFGWFSHRVVSFFIELSCSAIDNERIIRVCLNDSHLKLKPTNPAEPVLNIGMRISNFLDGHNDDFNDLKLDYSGLTYFQIQVLESARTIQWGRVVTYSELAEMAGYPNAVRATASVMRTNRFPLIIPCHRVVRKDGGSGGYCGNQSGPMFELKQILLRMEQNNRV